MGEFVEFNENLSFLEEHDRFDIRVADRKGNIRELQWTFREIENGGTSFFVHDWLEYRNPTHIRPHKKPAK